MDLMYITTVIVVILISMTLHEAMHAFASYWQGDDTAKEEGRLTLNPIKHIDPVLTIALPAVLALFGAPIFGAAKPVPFNPSQLRRGEWSVAIIALAGPLTNLFIAFVLYGIMAIFNISIVSLAGYFLLIGVYVNLGFFVFNMIPIPPLDGSRVLYVLAPDFVKRAMDMIEAYGIIVVFAIIMLASGVGLLDGVIEGSVQAILEVFRAIFGN